MEFTFENLLYDHSLTPLLRTPPEDFRREFYPGYGNLLADLRAHGYAPQSDSNAPNTLRLHDKVFTIRYRATDQNAFSPVRGGKIFAIIKKDSAHFSMAFGSPEELGASSNASWSVRNGIRWTDFGSADALNREIIQKMTGGQDV